MPASETLNDLDFTGERGAAAAGMPQREAFPGRGDAQAQNRPVNSIQVLRRRAKGVQTAAQALVLLVEDDEDMRRLMHRVLDRMGIAVRTAGESNAFQAALRKPPLPRLILLDVELPGVNGFKLLTALRRHPKTRDIPVLLVTSRSEDRDLFYGLTLGADGYLSKPFDIESLRAMVAKLLESPA